MTCDWDAPQWANAETLEITHFRSESSDHRPQTSTRVLYDDAGIHGLFRVEDRYLLCKRTEYLDPVWRDSCVEFFAQPKPESGYFNFEFNCGGALLCSYIINPERVPGGFREFTRLPPAIGKTIQTASSLPRRIDSEITEPTIWFLRFFVPFAAFEHYVGSLGPLSGQTWRGNFYKCADESSHPHWVAWSPVDELNFHMPRCFGTIRFE
jgi:hypothetical protein